jgi:hypothetical protein
MMRDFEQMIVTSTKAVLTDDDNQRPSIPTFSREKGELLSFIVTTRSTTGS